MACQNEVIQTVPKGFSYKEIKMKCGNTSIHGTPLYCDECNARFKKRGYAAHQCRHGKDMTEEGSFCNACEFGDE